MPAADSVFTSDDFVLMTQVREDSWQFFSGFGAGSQHYWRPLVLASLDILPSNSAVHHLWMNTLLHLGVVALIYGCCRMRGVPHAHALLAAVVFLTHWANASNVFWVSARTDLLSCFFLVAALFSYFAMVKRPSFGWALASLLAFGCALLSKEHAVMFPLIVGVFWMWDTRHSLELPNFKACPLATRLFWGTLPLMVLSYLLVLKLFMYQNASPPGPVSVGTWILSSIKSVVYAVLPFPVSVLGKKGAVGVVVVAGAAIGYFARLERGKSVSRVWVLVTGGAVFLLAGAPMLVFLNQTAPRLVYFPLAVTLVFFGAALKRVPTFPPALVCLLALALTGGSLMERNLWRENMAIARHLQNQFEEEMRGKDPQQPFVILGAPATRKGAPVFGNDANHALFFATYGRFGFFPNGAVVGQIDWPGGLIDVEGGFREGQYWRCIQQPAAYRFDPKAQIGDKFRYGPGETVVVEKFGPGQVRCFAFRFEVRFQSTHPMVFDFDGENLFLLPRNPMIER